MLSSTVFLERLSEKGRTFGWHQQIPQQVYVMYVEGMYKGQDTAGIYTERNKNSSDFISRPKTGTHFLSLRLKTLL